MKNTTKTRAIVAAATIGTAAAAGALISAASADAATPAHAAPACAANSVSVHLADGRGSKAHPAFVIQYHNTSGRTCTITGYPGLDALGGSGHVLTSAIRTLHGRAGGAPKVATVTVRPDTYASAIVEADLTGPDGQLCAQSLEVATTVPDTKHALTFTKYVPMCNLQVHPTVAGSSGSIL